MEIECKDQALRRTVVANGVAISTTRFPIDIQTERGGESQFFETMVFGGPMDGLQRRYTFEYQALAGHDQIVKELADRCRSCGTIREADESKCKSCGDNF